MKAAWPLTIALLLSGCASFAPEPPAVTRAAGAVTFHPKLEAEGRLSVRYVQNGKQEAPPPANFRWNQDGDNIDIVLLSPLNQTIARIAVTPTEAILAEAGKPVRSAASIEALSEDAFGWRLPVAGLRGWLQGFDVQDGRLRAIARPGVADAKPVMSQDGWQLQYVSWVQDDGSIEVRPRRIDLTRESTQFGQVSLRIVLDRWQPL